MNEPDYAALKLFTKTGNRPDMTCRPLTPPLVPLSPLYFLTYFLHDSSLLSNTCNLTHNHM